MVAVNTSFFSEMLQSIADRSRALIANAANRRAARSDGLIELCEDLLSGRGEASGVALADEILGDYAELTTGPRIAFFESLARVFGHDPARMRPPSRPGGSRRRRIPRPNCIALASRAGWNCSAG